MNNDIKTKDELYIANTYKRYPIHIKSGMGCNVFDDEDKEYLDFTSGIGVTGMGHCFQPWIDAICKQALEIEHISNLFYTTPAIRVAEKLCSKSEMKKVFFANSGAEANECAIKVARKYGEDRYDGKRNEIITLKNSFHGRTITTLIATGQDHFHHHFRPFPKGFRYVEANNLRSLKASITDKTLAIMIEMVQGEGGVIPLEKGYVEAIQAICEETNILLIIDEVQTGIARCGSLFAYMQYDLKPDIVTCAKGLGNGLPIGATLLNEKCEDVLTYGDHGSTFGGNMICCAGAEVILDFMDDKLYKHVYEMGELLKSQLAKIPYIKKVDGVGLMLGIEFDEAIKVNDVVSGCMEKGVLFLTAKHKLRLLPPLIIKEEEVSKAMNILKEVVIELGAKQ